MGSLEIWQLHNSLYLKTFLLMQKIRTVEQDEKTIKLQIVSTLFSLLKCNLCTLVFFCPFNPESHFSLLVGYCWSRAFSHDYKQLLPWCTWNYCMYFLLFTCFYIASARFCKYTFRLFLTLFALLDCL